MLLGYARVSTDDQQLDLQRDALMASGCDRLFTDTMSGVQAARPGLDEALAFLRSGDTLVVWRLDRLGRSLKALIELMTQLQARKIGFVSLSEQIDSTTSGGKLIFHVFGALAEFERDLIGECTTAGLATVRRRCSKLGRPRSLTPEQVEMAQTMMANPKLSARQIAAQLGVHRATLYRHLGRSEVGPAEQAER